MKNVQKFIQQLISEYVKGCVYYSSTIEHGEYSPLVIFEENGYKW